VNLPGGGEWACWFQSSKSMATCQACQYYNSACLSTGFTGCRTKTSTTHWLVLQGCYSNYNYTTGAYYELADGNWTGACC